MLTVAGSEQVSDGCRLAHRWAHSWARECCMPGVDTGTSLGPPQTFSRKKTSRFFFARVLFTLFSFAMAPKPTNVTPGRQIKPFRPGLQGYFSSNERFKRGGSVLPPTQSGPRITRFLTNLALLATPQAWRRVSDLSPQSRVGCEPSLHPTALPTPLPSWRPTAANLLSYSPAGQDRTADAGS